MFLVGEKPPVLRPLECHECVGGCRYFGWYLKTGLLQAGDLPVYGCDL